MEPSPFDELHALPDGFLDAIPETLHRILPRPAIIRLAGLRQPALTVVLMLHGNEPVGLQAVQRLLRRHAGRALPRALTLVVGNVRAAALGQRHLDDQPDFNRIWPGTEHPGSPEAAMFARIIERLRHDGLFATIDLHNNTGRNPHYACINRLGDSFLSLAAMFGRTVVYFTRPRGVASMALAALAPSVTLECGHPGEEAGIAHATEFVDAVLHLERFPVHAPAAQEIEIFHTVAQVRVRPGLHIGVGTSADVTLEPDLDGLNFQMLPAGTRLVRQARAGLDALVAIAPDGRDVTREYLGEAGTDVYLRQPMMPSMLTLDTRVIAQDCLCYLMEPMDLGQASRG
ncbi:succinylglutamate desuccinylase/aspartoacylase [Thioalkalivibrio nitratireducens DSM 14787]|uniref:Succinylglutamate desuccinylase/aspartoacylase n=1 Tax=Thioalkalivibrio nitratireducens (strain DSM 14787 / UNIQEM 213 / ALEN2) TaxID=1255043 RepID=L0DSV6_THIND|nr:M14 family metallopeptidase [Thioalkalivibrio nitratireducens]AGA32077.1 succinylglutamate desuccinylase/aspartoacylase [Thioalkalivibrio nitratireducens DSM 14787]